MLVSTQVWVVVISYVALQITLFIIIKNIRVISDKKIYRNSASLVCGVCTSVAIIQWQTTPLIVIIQIHFAQIRLNNRIKLGL